MASAALPAAPLSPIRSNTSPSLKKRPEPEIDHVRRVRPKAEDFMQQHGQHRHHTARTTRGHHPARNRIEPQNLENMAGDVTEATNHRLPTRLTQLGARLPRAATTGRLLSFLQRRLPLCRYPVKKKSCIVSIIMMDHGSQTYRCRYRTDPI